ENCSQFQRKIQIILRFLSFIIYRTGICSAMSRIDDYFWHKNLSLILFFKILYAKAVRKEPSALSFPLLIEFGTCTLKKCALAGRTQKYPAKSLPRDIASKIIKLLLH